LRLPAPPLSESTRHAAPAPTARLEQVSQQRNQIVDVDAWYRDQALTQLARELDEPKRDELESRGVPRDIEGTLAARVLVHEDHEAVLYDAPEQRGRYLVLVRADQLYGPYDFASYRDPPQGEGELTAMETRWAALQGETLFVSHAHLTYAKSSGGHNAYVTALSAGDGTLLWRSRPLVANAEECALWETTLICGYGFTAEPDFVHVLDANSGKVTQQLPVRSGPEHILRQGTRVFVRTYDTNYEFDLKPSQP
jgi:hypothetical protein